MAKLTAKFMHLDPNTLFDNVGNLSVKFNDVEQAASNQSWSSDKVENYINTLAQGLDSKQSCRAATNAILPDCTYNNGTSGVGATLTGDSNGVLASQDSVTLVVGDRLLVKDQVSGLENGIYNVTVIGNASTAFVLTRNVDFDNSPNGEVSGGAFTFIEEGGTLSDSGWVVTTTGDITVGTTSIDWSQFSGTGSILAGTGMTKDGNTININNGVIGNQGGINIGSSDISIATGIGLEVNSNLLRLASTAAGDGLTGGSGSALSIDVSDFVGTGLEENSGDIQIAASAAGDGIQGGGGSALAIDVADFVGTGLEESGGDIRIDSTAAGIGLTGGSGSALTVSPDTTGGANLAKSINVLANGVAIKVDGSSIDENGSGQLEIIDNGININQISSAIAGDGLQGGGGSALAVDVSDFAGTGLEDDTSENLRISSTAAGNGLTGGSGSALAVNEDSTASGNLANAVNSSSNGVSVRIDDSTIGEDGSGQLEIKAAGITEIEIASASLGNGLTGGSGTTLAVDISEYITGGSVEIDGDKLDIDWDPTYYTPAVTPAQVDNVDNLTAHLYGIDQAFADISNEQIIQEMHAIDSSENTNGYFLLAYNPVNTQSVRVTVVQGNMQMNNAVIGTTGETPDFEVQNILEVHFNNNGAASGLSELLETGDVVVIEYPYEIETGMDGNGDLMPFVGDPENATNVFEENGPSAIMSTTSGTDHDFFEIIGGEITPKE